VGGGAAAKADVETRAALGAAEGEGAWRAASRIRS